MTKKRARAAKAPQGGRARAPSKRKASSDQSTTKKSKQSTKKPRAGKAREPPAAAAAAESAQASEEAATAKAVAEEAKAAKARAKVTNAVIKAVKLAAKDALQPLRAEEKRKKTVAAAERKAVKDRKRAEREAALVANVAAKEKQRLAVADAQGAVDALAWVAGIPQDDLRELVLAGCANFQPTGDQPVTVDRGAFDRAACTELAGLYCDHFLERSMKTMLAFGSPCTRLSDLRLVGAMALPIELQSPPHHEWAVPHPTPRRLLLLWHVSLPLV
jgi:hypothetical protein